MPSVSGWGLRHAAHAPRAPRATPERFYALGIGLGFATRREPRSTRVTHGFYALGIGLGFATIHELFRVVRLRWFLCPRYRAGVCDAAVVPSGRTANASVSMPS